MFGMVHDQGNGFHGFVPPREPPAAAIQTVPEGHVYKENKLKMAKHSGIFPKYAQQGIGELARKYQREILVHPAGDSADYVQTLPAYVQGLSKKRKAEEANLYSHDEVAAPQAQCRYIPPSPVLISSSSGNRVVPKGTSFTRRQMQQFAVCNSGFFSTNTAALTSVNHYSTHASTTTTSKANTKSASTQGDYAIIVGEVLNSSNEAYEVLAFLGRGTFGQVVKCRCQSTRRCVAIKILKNLPSYLRQGNVEIQILQTLSQQDTESHNIVRAIECFQHKNHMCFVFELLEQNLYEYLKSNKFRPLSLPEIRPIAQQVLTALSKLKSLGLIHADLKPENIMLVSSSNGAMRYRVKVIDFGSACHSSKAVQNTYLQSRYYRAPEILLGLPFNEAIDMWSLGCVIAELFLGWPLYPGSSEYDQMRYIVETQGLPPADLLQNAGKCGTFFVRDPYTCEWRLKTQEEYTLETGQQAKEARKYFFTSLSQICDVTGLPAPDDPDRDFEIGDRHQFASLLSLMLKMRPSERVVPDVSLSHPFITMVHLQAYPFSKRFHESVALMQVCHEATRRQQAQNVRNNTQQFGSLPSLNERRSGEIGVSSVLPSPVSSNRGAEGDQYEISKNSINNAGTAVAYYAAAAVAAAALGKPTPQISPGERRPSDSNYFKQHKLSSLVIDTHQQLSGALASADHSCQANYPANAAATVLLNQNSADAFIRSNQSNPISGSGGASVPHSISLYDLVAAGGNALSLLNAVAAPVSSGTASVNPIPARHIQLSPTSSHDYLHRFQQPFQPICNKPKIQGHLPSEAEHAVLVLSSYLGRDRESRLQQTEPQKLGASVGTADICDTLNAFVQQQQQLCRNSNVFEAAQQQNLTTYQQELLAIPPAVDYNATSLISRHPSCAMALASQNSLFQNSLGHTTRMNIHHSRQRQLVNFQYQLPAARLDPGCLVAEQEPKIQVSNVKPFTTSAIPLGDNPSACLQQSSQGYSTVLLQQQRPQHHEQSTSLHYRPELISFAPARASFSTQSEKSPNPLSFPGFGDNAPMNLVTTNETANSTAEPGSLGVFSMEPLPSSWASQPELSVKQRTSGSLTGSQAVIHNLDILPQMSVSSALNSTADSQFAVPTAARPKGISGKSDSQLFSSDGCSEGDFQSSIGQTNGDPSDLERISESEKSNLSEVGECKPTMNAYVTPIRNPPSQRSDKKIPVGRVQPMIKQEDTSSAVHFLSSPNLNCMSGAIGESLGPSLYGNTNLQCAPHCGVRNAYHQILARKSPDRTAPTSGRQNFRKQHPQQPQLSFSRTDHQVQSNRRLSAAHAAAAAYHNLMFFQLQQQQLQQQTQRHLQNQVSVSFPPTMSSTINSVHLAAPTYQTQHRIHLTPNETCWPPTEFDDPATAAAASYYAAAAAAAAAVAQREQQQQQQQQQQQRQHQQHELELFFDPHSMHFRSNLTSLTAAEQCQLSAEILRQQGYHLTKM